MPLDPALRPWRRPPAPLFRNRLIAAVAALATLGLAAAASAMTITPVILDMETIGRHSTSAIRVENTFAQPLPVEIVVWQLELDENAGQERIPGDDDWLVFPPQALIEPGRTQVFRIQWLGDPDLEQGRSYIFSINQLPVQQAEGSTAVQLLYNFGVPVSIAPPGGAPELALAELDIERSGNPGERPVVVVENSGNAHGYLSGAELSLALYGADGRELWAADFTREETEAMAGVGLIQPDNRRRFVLPIDLPPGGQRLEGTIRHVGRR